MTELTLHLGGVSCGGCAQRVNAALAQVPGVVKSEVNDDRTRVVVRGEALERAPLVAAIVSAGYQVLDSAAIPLTGV
ncbi:MAG: heavy-metal-associated domain-containing protein [Roseiflexaceae bacterium]|jgi:copper chaperone CopZ|nr:MAG: copper chaperone [Chloroflexota bacterium]RLT33880.1 MAG: copper chaperone [Chloroflexota bacterium]